MSKSIKKGKSEIAAKILKLLECGREELTSQKQLEKYNIGSMISYLNTGNIFKMGGFITKFEDESFVFITPDFTKKYRVKYQNVQKMWAGDVYKVKNDVVSIVESEHPPTKYKVTVGNINVYYAKKSIHIKRYVSTDKYKRMINWCEYFEKGNTDIK
jgi:hypothetical protein